MNEHELKTNNVSVQNQSVTFPDDDHIDVEIEDLEYLFDTPEQSALRSQIHRKIKYIYKYKRKINCLQQKNIEITHQNKKLKEEILECVKKSLVECLDLKGNK